MEEDNDLEQVTGSPTAGDNGFVHVESADSAQTDGGSINQVENLEQDDGVVVTEVDTVHDEPQSARTTEDAGHDEFVDCPDALISSEARSPGLVLRAHQQPFRIPTEDIQSKTPDNEKEILPQDSEEEKTSLMKEVSNLHHQLKVLSKQRSNDAGVSSNQLTLETGEGSEKSLREMVNECSKFIELSLNEQSQAENTIQELNATLHMKDKEIEDLTVRVHEHSTSQDVVALKSDDVSSAEATADRILSSVATVFGEAELSDVSVNGKLSHLERSTFFLLEKYHYFLSEVEMLSRCLAEIKSDFNMQNGMETVFVSVREELLALKRKELESAEKNIYLEYQHEQLMEQVNKDREAIELLNAEIEKLKGEVEQEKMRYANTKEKLSMAVTKGKALVQQRDSLKQSVAEKASELERCVAELQEKSSALEAAELRIGELTQTAILANSMQEALSQRDFLLQKCGEILSLSGVASELQSSDIVEGVTWLANERSRLVPLAFEFQRLADVLSSLELPQDTQFPNLESQVTWLLEAYNLAKDQYVKLQDEVHATKEADRAQIDHLTASMLVETQEKYYLKEEFEDLKSKYEGIVKEKKQIVSLLLDASGISIDDSEENSKLQSDMPMVINRCFSKIHEQARASTESSSHLDKEVLEKIQIMLYERDLESKLYGQILEEEKIYRLMQVKVSEELHGLKDDNNSLQTNLQRSEEKASLLRDKLSMAVKKGKGLVQERENMKQQMAEKNAQIEALTLDLHKKESDLLRWKQERDQVEQYLIQSNNMLHQLYEAIDGVHLPVDLKEPIEKVKFFATYLSECEVAKAQAELELGDIKDEAGVLAHKLTEALKTMKTLEETLSVSEKNVSVLAEEKRALEVLKTSIEEELQKSMEEFQVSKTQVEQEVQTLNEEIITLNKKLVEALRNLKTLEDTLSGSEKTISQLSEEKQELEISKSRVEEELHKAIEEATSHRNKFQEALSLAENNASLLMTEKEEAQSSKIATEMELQKVKEEVSSHAINLNAAHQSIKSLEDAMSHLQTNVSQFSQENDKALDGRTILETEIKKLKEEAVFHEQKVVDAQQEITALNIELNTCRQELAHKHDKFASDLSHFFGNLQAMLKDESLSSLFKQSFEKKIENLKEIDHVLKDLKNNFDSEQLQGYPAIEEILQSSFLSGGFDNDWNSVMIDDTFSSEEDIDDIGSFSGKTLNNFKTRNGILADQFGSFSTLIDAMIESLLKKLESIRNTMPFMVQQTKALQMDKQMQDNSIKVLVSACADVTKELHFQFEKNALQTNDKLNPSHSPYLNVKVGDEEALTDVKAASDALFFAATNVGNLIQQYVSVKENMSTTIQDLRGELEKTRSMYDKAKEENDASERRAFELETALEASGKMSYEMSSKLEDYRTKEDRWNVRERELSALSTSQENDAKRALLSASQINSLFDKINGIPIPFPHVVAVSIHPQDSDPVKKLFYIVDSVNELLDQMSLLRSSLSKQTLEVEHLKGEFKDSMTEKQDSEKLCLGLQSIIQKLGGDEAIGVKKSVDVAGLLPVLERLIQGVVLDSENSRFKAHELGSKLVQTQKVADELSSKVKLLEDHIQNRTGGSDIIQERSIFEAPSLPARSEISEIEDQGPVGKVGLPLVPSAAHVRSLRKGSSDQLAINIDSESDRLLNKSETVADKGHIFKSLHTSGLVPVKGKMIADRLDGIWVSGGQALMRRPRARLGVIAYWLVLHLWLLGTIL